MTKHTFSFAEFQGHRLSGIAHLNPSPTKLPVVWIHGLTASVNFWEDAMYEEIRNERSWFSIGLPFHFPSTYSGRATPSALDEYLLAELMDRAINELIPEGDFHLAGYSVGGFAALNYAAKYPARVRSVISIGGFLTGRARGLEGALQFFSKGKLLRKALFHMGFRTLKTHPAFFKLATLSYARQWRALLRYPQLDPTIRRIFPNVQQHDIEAQRAWFRYLLDMNLMDEHHCIEHPTLVIAGDRDPIIPFHHQQAYAKMLPNAQLAVLPGVGHVPFAEAPLAFRTELLQWLNHHG
nr:alpha/beta hydrolase [Lewinella sp. W8]